ncbi:hypothetical protein H5410_057827 [Solanum commersonii]|uniref:Uncharacterized protein n=1 Tax=Solanum commersonii TaxID=4109 RepID=A0A9J5WQV2_SOLCO|nr:hypothetical protein H5410_057827 [Solanum commersonii]
MKSSQLKTSPTPQHLIECSGQVAILPHIHTLFSLLILPDLDPQCSHLLTASAQIQVFQLTDPLGLSPLHNLDASYLLLPGLTEGVSQPRTQERTILPLQRKLATNQGKRSKS